MREAQVEAHPSGGDAAEALGQLLELQEQPPLETRLEGDRDRELAVGDLGGEEPDQVAGQLVAMSKRGSRRAMPSSRSTEDGSMATQRRPGPTAAQVFVGRTRRSPSSRRLIVRSRDSCEVKP